jgi:hypothetical protein
MIAKQFLKIRCAIALPAAGQFAASSRINSASTFYKLVFKLGFKRVFIAVANVYLASNFA